MPPAPPAFDIDDAKSFNHNLSAFLDSLKSDDPALAKALLQELPKMLRGEITTPDLYDALAAVLEAQGT
jgi:hypothetical protein